MELDDATGKEIINLLLKRLKEEEQRNIGFKGRIAVLTKSITGEESKPKKKAGRPKKVEKEEKVSSVPYKKNPLFKEEM